MAEGAERMRAGFEQATLNPEDEAWWSPTGWIRYAVNRGLNDAAARGFPGAPGAEAQPGGIPNVDAHMGERGGRGKRSRPGDFEYEGNGGHGWGAGRTAAAAVGVAVIATSESELEKKRRAKSSTISAPGSPGDNRVPNAFPPVGPLKREVAFQGRGGWAWNMEGSS